MITAFKPIGVGANTAAINVFRISFSTALSDIPKLRAYDSYSADTTANTILIGTAYLAYPMVAAIGGTAPGATPWFPASPTPGDTNAGTANMLKGTTYGIKLALSAPGAGGNVVFNLAYKFPYDVTTLATMEHVVVCEYQYTGAAPTVTFAGNKTPGTEGSPNWVSLDSLAIGTVPSSGNVTQVSPCDTGKGGDGDATYRASIPSSGTAFPDEIWVRDF